jgi:hypothetical protein
MLRYVGPLLVLTACATRAPAPIATPLQPDPVLPVAGLEAQGRPNFDVALHEPSGRLYFIHQSGAGSPTLTLAESADGGLTWTPPEALDGEGWSPRLEVDSRGTLHLAFGRKLPGLKGDIENRVWYRSRPAGGRWSAPQELEVAPSVNSYTVSGARLAIDGNDNVHVIAWKIVSVGEPGGEEGDWKTFMRAVYGYRPAAAAAFGPTVELQQRGSGTGSGDIVRDAAGDVHILYNTWGPSPQRWSTTHVVRRKDGNWSPEIHGWPTVGGDFGFAAAVDGRGVVHIAGFDQEKGSPSSLDWAYFNNAADRSEAKLLHHIDDDWNITTDILVEPAGHVWMSRSNNKDKLAKWTRYDARTDTWSTPVLCSPPGTKNVESRWDQMPKFVSLRGGVRLFYAEQRPDGPFVFRQRWLSGTP